MDEDNNGIELLKEIKIKCVAIGDGMVGKTCLLITYVSNVFPAIYVPTVFDTYAHKTKQDDYIINLHLYDTAGQEEYERLRPLSYPDTNVILICFSVVHPDSFVNVKEKWYQEVKYYCPEAKIIMVGTKKDLRDDPLILENLRRNRSFPITPDKAENLRKELNIYSYIECSAKTQENLALVFEEAIRSCLPKKKQPKPTCCLII